MKRICPSNAAIALDAGTPVLTVVLVDDQSTDGTAVLPKVLPRHWVKAGS